MRVAAIVRLTGMLLVGKLCYLLLFGAFLRFHSDSSRFGDCDIRWPRTGDAILESHFAAWDGAYYLRLALDGYRSGDASCAFYPIWPALIRIAIKAGFSPVWGGVLVSNLASVAAWILFYKIAESRIGERAARRALTLLIIYPGSLFFQFAYSESLFLLEVLVLVISLDLGWISAACAAAFLIPMTRAIGLLVLVPLLINLVLLPRLGVLTRELDWAKWKIEATRPPGVRGVDVVYPLASIILGWACYLFLMWKWTGSPFEGFAAQEHWGRHSIVHLFDVRKFFVELFSISSWHEFSGSLLDRILFLPAGIAIILSWRQYRDWCPWIFVLAILPAMSGGFTSFTRFGSIAFPVFLFWGKVLSGYGWGVRAGVFFTLMVVHFALVWRYLNFGWAG